MGFFRRFILFVAALGLSACATNVLRLEYAEDLSARGKAAAAASSAFLGKVEDARIAANLELVEADPNCRPNMVNIRLAPDLSASDAANGANAGWLCAASANDGTVELSLAPLGPELEPTFQLISALGSYSQAIVNILEGEVYDPAEDFIDTLALLRAAEGTICALDGGVAPSGGADGAATCQRPSGAGPAIPDSDDPRLEAVGSALTFLGELASEQSKVDQLRKLRAQGPAGASLATALQEHLRDWDLSRRADIVLLASVENALMAQALSAVPPPAASKRRAYVEQYYQRQKESRNSLRAFAALDAMLSDLALAEDDLHRVLEENPDLTDAEKAQVARIYRSRVTRALNSITALITAF
ncbi:MAG: hypothetical protein ACX930_10985 [Erythrobacter sp.]